MNITLKDYPSTMALPTALITTFKMEFVNNIFDIEADAISSFHTDWMSDRLYKSESIFMNDVGLICLSKTEAGSMTFFIARNLWALNRW